MNILTPPRYSLVPWLWPSDLDEGRRAMWDVEYRGGREHASCWAVKLYEQGSSHAMYTLVHATRGNGNDGGTITLSLSETPQFDVYAKDTFEVNAKSIR